MTQALEKFDLHSAIAGLSEEELLRVYVNVQRAQAKPPTNTQTEPAAILQSDYIGHAGTWKGQKIVTTSQPTYHSDNKHYIGVNTNEGQGHVPLSEIQFATNNSYEAAAAQPNQSPQRSPGRMQTRRHDTEPKGLPKKAILTAVAAVALLSPGPLRDIDSFVEMPPLPNLPAHSQKHESIFDRFKNLIHNKDTASPTAQTLKPDLTSAPIIQAPRVAPEQLATKPPDAQKPPETIKTIPIPAIPESKPAEKWTPNQNLLYETNGQLVVWSDRNLPGVTDLMYKDEKGQWKLYNNLVPVATVGDKVSNAELDNVKAKRSITKDSVGDPVSVLDYKFPNGAHVKLEIKMNPLKNSFTVTAIKQPDSVNVDRFYVGNFLGIEDGVQKIVTENKTITVDDLDKPNDGYGIPGTFKDFALGTDKSATLIGRIKKQKIKLISGGEDENPAKIRVERRSWAFKEIQDETRSRINGDWLEFAGIETSLKSPIKLEFSIE